MSKQELSAASGAGENEFSSWEIFDPGSDLWQSRNATADEPITAGDCIRVKTPSQGVTTFDIDGDPAKEIRGILCYVGKRGVVWPFEKMDDGGGGNDPVFVTDDLVTARRVGDETGDLDMEAAEAARNPDGTYRWRELPFVYPNGRRDRESRILYVLREGDVLPLAINASAASVYAIGSFLKRLAKPQWRHAVSVTLTKEESKTGVKFAKFQVKVVGTLTPEQGEIIKNLYSRGLAAMSGVDLDRPAAIGSRTAPALAAPRTFEPSEPPAAGGDEGAPF